MDGKGFPDIALGNGGKEPFFQFPCPGFFGVEGVVYPFCRRARFQNFGRKGLADLSVLVVDTAQQIHRPLAADHLDPHALVEFNRGQ